MPEIILTDDQAREFSQAREKVILRNPQGEMIGVLDPLDAIRDWQIAGRPLPH